MSDITRIEDHSGDALARVIDQFSASTRYQDLIRSFVDPCQAIEDSIYQLLVQRSVDTATGVQLDNLGEIVDQPREGRDDEAYRLWINARILANRSTGRPDDSLAIMQLLAASAVVTLTEYFAAYSVSAYGLDDDPATVAAILRQVKPAGVGFWFEYSDVVIDTVFTMDDDTTLTLDPVLGFGDAGDPGVGGFFAGVI